MFKKDIYNSVFSIARVLLEKLTNDERLDSNIFVKEVDKAINVYGEKADYYRDRLIKDLKNIFSVQSSTQSIISFNQDHKEWYFKERNRIDLGGKTIEIF